MILKATFAATLFKHARAVAHSAWSLFGGNASDHASDTRKESRETFKQLLWERQDEGVEPKSILLHDLFHAKNLCMTHSSWATFGETERGNNRWKDHRDSFRRAHA